MPGTSVRESFHVIEFITEGILREDVLKDYIKMSNKQFVEVKPSLIEIYKKLVKDTLNEILSDEELVDVQLKEDDDFVVLETTITIKASSITLRFIPFFYFNNTKRLQVYTLRGVKEILKDEIEKLIQEEQKILKKLV